VAVGLLFMVSSETRMSGNGLENDQAYYGAESGMEKLTADLSSLYTAYMVPTNTQIQALATNPPSSSMVGSITYNETITYQTNPLTGARSRAGIRSAPARTLASTLRSCP